jgi:hypothetical protein
MIDITGCSERTNFKPVMSYGYFANVGHFLTIILKILDSYDEIINIPATPYFSHREKLASVSEESTTLMQFT